MPNSMASSPNKNMEKPFDTIIDFVDHYAAKYGDDTFLREKVGETWTETSFKQTREEGRIYAAGFMAVDVSGLCGNNSLVGFQE